MSRETACIAGGRWEWITTWGTDFVQCADFGSLLDRGRGGGIRKILGVRSGSGMANAPIWPDDPMSFSTH